MKRRSKLLFVISAAVFVAGFWHSAFAGEALYQRFEANSSAVLGEFLFDDNYAATTTAPCAITVKSPTGYTVENASSMTANSDGWYSYSFTASSTEGFYRATMSCGATSTGDLIIVDKSFFVGPSFLSATTIASSTWSYAGSALDTTGNAIAKIWSYATRRITSRQIGAGSEYIAGVTSTSTVAQVANEADQTIVKYNVELVRKATFDFAGVADSGTTLTLVDVELDQPDDYWNNYELKMMSGNNIGQNKAISGFNKTTNTITVLSAFSFAVAAGDEYVISHDNKLANIIWNYSARTLTSFGTLMADIWSNPTRTLTGFGSLAADVWNGTFAPTRRLTDETLTGGGKIATQTDIANATTTLIAEINENQALITALNNISAADVWLAATRTLTDYATSSIATASANEVWGKATSTLTGTGSIGKHLVDNINAAISSRGTSNLTAADVWLAATRTLTDYSTSTIATAVWSSATRTLTNYGNDITAQNVWDTLTSSLTTANSIGKALADNRVVKFNANGEIVAGSGTNNYKAKLYIYDLSSQMVNAAAIPSMTLYQPDGTVGAGPTSMTLDVAGIYSYQTTLGSGATVGRWEAVVTIDLGGASTIKTGGYFEVEASPAQVIINSITDNTVPSIVANVTISNEGNVGNEYQYEYCIVSTLENKCGGGDDVAYALAAKFINPGEDFITNLALTANTPGTYFFKVVVYWSTEKSVAIKQFTAISEPAPGPTPTPSPGGGGGGGVPTPTPVTTPAVCSGADFNHDSIVNSVDFSILLYFWKTQSPFRNSCVDINKDIQVNSVDFSILLYQWGKSGVNIK